MLIIYCVILIILFRRLASGLDHVPLNTKSIPSIKFSFNIILPSCGLVVSCVFAQLLQLQDITMAFISKKC